MFLISDEYLEVYPFNVDPRMIKSLDNGVKLQINRLRKVYHVFGPRYILVTDDEILYVKMVVMEPELDCSIKTKGSGVYHVVLQNNISSCELYSPLRPHKKSFNSYC